MGDAGRRGRRRPAWGMLATMACVAMGLGVACAIPCMAAGSDGSRAGAVAGEVRREDTGALRVAVAITGGTAKAREANRFGIAIELSGKAGEKATGTASAKGPGNDRVTVRVNGGEREEPSVDDRGRLVAELADGDEVLVEGIPAGTRYFVTEESPEWFEQAPSGARGEVRGGRVAEASFDNAYLIEGKARVEATLVTLGDEGAMGGASFRLEDEEGNLVATATNDADGDIRFPEMTFGASADGMAYRYVVTEEAAAGADGRDDVVRDDTEFPVVIMAEDSEGRGEMDVGVAYTPASGIVFRNMAPVDVPEGEPERAGAGTAMFALMSMGVITLLVVDMARAGKARNGR